MLNKHVIENQNEFNDYDILLDCKQTLHDLLLYYFNFLVETSSNDNFNIVETVAYELIEDYRSLIELLKELGWYSNEVIDNNKVIELVFELKKKRKEIATNNNHKKN